MNGTHRILEAITQNTDDLFVVGLNDIEVVFRLPSIKVCSQYVLSLQACETESERVEIYESLFRYIVEDDWLTSKASTIPAGIPETISKLAIMLSGLDEHNIEYTEQLLELYREQSKSNIMYMKRMICQVFPGYKFEDLDLLNYQKLVNTFIQAEKLLIDQGIMVDEHSLKDKKETKPKPFRVEDIINQDKQAYMNYDNPNPDPQDLANRQKMQRIREEAIKHAKEKERQYMQQLARKSKSR